MQTFAGGGCPAHRRQQRGVLDQLGDRAPDRVVGQPQQPARLAVRQQQAVVAPDDDDAFADRVQHRVVVVIERSELIGVQSARLAPDASCDEQRQEHADHDGDRQRGEQSGKLIAHLVGDRLLQDADRDEPGDTRAIADRGDRTHGGAQRSRRLLGERPARARRRDRADELAADPRGVRVRVAHAGGAHEHHEPQVRRAPHAFGKRLQQLRRIVASQRRTNLARHRQRLGQREHPLPLLLCRAVVRGADGDGAGHDDRDHDDHQLQQQELTSEAHA